MNASIAVFVNCVKTVLFFLKYDLYPTFPPSKTSSFVYCKLNGVFHHRKITWCPPFCSDATHPYLELITSGYPKVSQFSRSTSAKKRSLTYKDVSKVLLCDIIHKNVKDLEFWSKSFLVRTHLSKQRNTLSYFNLK